MLNAIAARRIGGTPRSRRPGPHRGAGRGARGATALAIAALCLAAGAPPSHAAQIGLVSSTTWGESPTEIRGETVVDYFAGAKWVRMNANWKELEQRRGVIDASVLARYDDAVQFAHYAGLKIVMPISDGVPYWASSDPGKRVDSAGVKHWDQMYPPSHPRDYKRAVRFVVEHFGRLGVDTFEIWNEPNHSRFWKPRPSAKQYTKLLKAGYRGVKGTDPSARVLLGGLAGNDYRFLRKIYRAGGGEFFDAAAVHPYTAGSPLQRWRNRGGRISAAAFPAIKEVRRTMIRHGDRGRKLWVTEFGYSTAVGLGGVSEAAQAKYLTEAFGYVDRFPWVKAMLWYHGRDWTGGDAYGGSYGITRANYSPKPAFFAFQELATAG